MSKDSQLIYTAVPCHICGAQQLHEFSNYPSLPRVASDCVPWHSGGHLATCTACQCVQTPIDQNWHDETSKVYSKYKIYTQSAGSEQSIITADKKQMPRSAKVFQQAAPFLDLSKPGRLLDIGCANGELLRCFGGLAPAWQMVGFEIDDKHRKEVESIPGVEAFASGSLDKIKGPFDIITLVHVFEHLPFPVRWLEDIKHLLTPHGLVLIQVPNPQVNPYNLLVADHCSHFVMPDLIKIAHQANYEVITHSDAWVKRELSILLRPRQASQSKPMLFSELTEQYTATYPKNSLQWLSDIIKQAQAIPYNHPRGIWGTAIAATWLFSLMDSKVDFFVDEDTNRIGQEHLGKPVYSPDQVPENANVFIALTPEIAANIISRWSHLKANLVVPPALVY